MEPFGNHFHCTAFLKTSEHDFPEFRNGKIYKGYYTKSCIIRLDILRVVPYESDEITFKGFS